MDGNGREGRDVVMKKLIEHSPWTCIFSAFLLLIGVSAGAAWFVSQWSEIAAIVAFCVVFFMLTGAAMDSLYRNS